MGATESKTPKKTPISNFTPSSKRVSKRILKRNSAIYPTNIEQSVNNNDVEKNNNSSNPKQENQKDDFRVVIRGNLEISDESLSVSTPKSAKKEKKKKKSEVGLSGDDTLSTYHQTNVCYYKVDNGKFLKLPNDTKHKSNDGCYIKLSNGSFRHLMVPDGAGSRPEVYFKPKSVRQSMPTPVQKHDERCEEKHPQNRKVMVTMIDGGLPVLAISKREKTTNAFKKEKEKIKVIFLYVQMTFFKNLTKT